MRSGFYQRNHWHANNVQSCTIGTTGSITANINDNTGNFRGSTNVTISNFTIGIIGLYIAPMVTTKN